MGGGTGTGFGRNKNLGEMALNGAKYIGKNFWKVLPVGSAINYQNKIKSTGKGIYYDTPEEFLKKALHGLYALAGICTLGIYASLGTVTGAWTPKQIREYNEKARIKNQIETEHKSEVNYNYGRIFEDAKSFQDSVDIYNKYGLPIKLLNPTLKQKEEAIEQNSLERSVK